MTTLDSMLMMNRGNTRSIGESSSDLNLGFVHSTLNIGIDYLPAIERIPRKLLSGR